MWVGLVPWTLWLMVGEDTQIEGLARRVVPANWERAGPKHWGARSSDVIVSRGTGQEAAAN